jgi:hypothetical protein
VIIAVDPRHLDLFGKKVIEEAKKITIGKYDAFKHQPHFQGGEYHGHSDLPGGYQVTWTVSGQRLHPNKFPADEKIPKDAKIVVAKVLGVPVDLLEVFIAYDEMEKKEVIVFELRGDSRAARILKEYSTLMDKNNGKA